MEWDQVRSFLRGSQNKFIVLQHNSLGRFCLSMHAIELLAEHRVKSVPGVSAAKAEAGVVASGISIYLKVNVEPGSDINRVAEAVEAAAREEILDRAGTEVYRVRVEAKEPVPHQNKFK